MVFQESKAIDMSNQKSIFFCVTLKVWVLKVNLISDFKIYQLL